MKDINQFLEFLKYYTLKNSKVGFKTRDSYIDYISEDTLITTPEGYSFTIKLLRIDIGGFCFSDTEGDENYYNYFDLQNILTLGINSNKSMRPEFISNSSLSGNSYTRFVFLSDFCQKNKVENPDWFTKTFNQYGPSNTSYDYFPSSMVILVKTLDLPQFQDFLNLSYGNILLDSSAEPIIIEGVESYTIGSWKYFFNQAIHYAFDGDLQNLKKYDPRIIGREVNEYQRLYLIENFEILELPPDIIINLFKTKEKKVAQSIIRLLKDESLQLIFKLNRFFWHEIDQFLPSSDTPEKIKYIVDYGFALRDLFNTQFEFTDLMLIAANEVNVYNQYEGQWNVFNKLAKEADTFIYNPNFRSPINIRLDQYGNELDEPCYSISLRDQYFPFDTLPNTPIDEQNRKLAFSYRAFTKSPNNIVECRKKELFSNYDPLKLVKVYILKSDKTFYKDLEKIDTKQKLFNIYSVPPEKSEVTYVLMPMITLVNLYTINNYYQDQDLINFFKGYFAAELSAFFTVLAPIGSISSALGIADTIAMTGSTILQMPQTQELLYEYDQKNSTNYQQEINETWATIQNTILVLNIGYASLFAVKTITTLALNYQTYRIALNQFKNYYASLTPELREKLSPLMNNGFLKLQKVVEEWEAYLHTVDNAFKPGETVGKILQERANSVFRDPSEYLKESYINGQYDKFANGYSFLTLEQKGTNWLTEGFPTIGRPDGTFVMPLVEMDLLLQKTNGNLVRICEEIGIDLTEDVTWVTRIRDGDKLLRVDINFNQINVRKLPVGSEGAANGLWLPGGVTPKNWSELIIESISKTNLNSSQIKYVKLN